MSKNRHNFTQGEEEKGEKEITLNFTPCLVCDKEIKTGYYGRFQHGGVCSKTCNSVQETRPKLRGEPL